MEPRPTTAAPMVVTLTSDVDESQLNPYAFAAAAVLGALVYLLAAWAVFGSVSGWLVAMVVAALTLTVGAFLASASNSR